MAQQSHFFMSHNIDFATYPRTGVFWRGGLLHSVSGVSYWTLWAGIVGHLRPYANNGRILLANLEISFHCTTIESCVDATTVNSRVEQRACRLVQTFSMEHFSGNVLQEMFI